MGNEIRDAGVPIPAGVQPFVSVPPQVINTEIVTNSEKVTNNEKIDFKPLGTCEEKIFTDVKLLIKQTEKELEVSVGSLVFPLKEDDKYARYFNQETALKRELNVHLNVAYAEKVQDNWIWRGIVKEWKNALFETSGLRMELADEVADFHKEVVEKDEAALKKLVAGFQNEFKLFKKILLEVIKIEKEGKEGKSLVRFVFKVEKWGGIIRNGSRFLVAWNIEAPLRETITKHIAAKVSSINAKMSFSTKIPEITDFIISRSTQQTITAAVLLMSNNRFGSIQELHSLLSGIDHTIRELQKKIISGKSNYIDARRVEQHNPYLIDEK